MAPYRTRGPGGLIADPRLPTRRRGLAASALILAFTVAADAPKPDPEAPPPKAEQAESPTKPKKDEPAETPRAAERVALSNGGTTARAALKPDLSARASQLVAAAAAEPPIARAVRTMEECQARFEKVRDYTCVFTKRERIDGKLGSLNIMRMKVRNEPRSVYMRFVQPYRGREAIYVEGRNRGRVLAHDVGLTKLLAGTLELDPRGARAMQECRHPITEAGIGALIETVLERWKAELDDTESVVLFDESLSIGPARCLLIEAIHPERGPNFVFHKVRLFIDVELGFPVRFEGYDWPAEEGGEAALVEEYAYGSLKLNVGLTDHDFDTANRLYSFGRF